MNNNEPGFTNKIAAIAVTSLPLVFLAGWIWQVLNSGAENRLYIACTGGFAFVGYMGFFIKLTKIVLYGKKETDPWHKDFRRPVSDTEYFRSQTVNRSAKGNAGRKNTQFGVIVAFFAIAILFKDIRHKGGIHSVEEAVTTVFIILVMVLVLLGNVKANSQRRADRNSAEGYDSSRHTGYFTMENRTKCDLGNKGITFYCPYCDEKLEQSFEFCPRCGNKLHKR